LSAIIYPIIIGENGLLRLLFLIIINLFLLSTFFLIIIKHSVIKQEYPERRTMKNGRIGVILKFSGERTLYKERMVIIFSFIQGNF